MTPWSPSNDPSAPLIQVRDVVSKQLEFAAMKGILFEESDCRDYGDNGLTLIAIKFCIRESGVKTALDIGQFKSSSYAT